MNLTELKYIPQEEIIGRDLGPILGINEIYCEVINVVFEEVLMVCRGISSSGDGYASINFYERKE